MIKLIGTAYKRDDFTTEEFLDYWFDVHAPHLGHPSRVAGYRGVGGSSETGWRVGDRGVREQWYDDDDAWDRASATPQAAAAWEDVGNYAKTTGTFWVVKEHVIVPPPDRGPGLAATWKE